MTNSTTTQKQLGNARIAILTFVGIIIIMVMMAIEKHPSITIRLSVNTEDYGLLDMTEGREEGGIPLTRTVYGKAEGLSDYKEGTFYIVSQLVKNALPQRKDLLVPTNVVRNKAGNIVGCESLCV